MRSIHKTPSKLPISVVPQPRFDAKSAKSPDEAFRERKQNDDTK